MQKWFFKKNLIQNKQTALVSLQTAKPNWCIGTVSRAGWCRVEGWAFIIPLTNDAGFRPTCEFQLKFLGQIFILGWLFPAPSLVILGHISYTISLSFLAINLRLFRRHKLHKIWILTNSERKTSLLSPLPTYHLKFFNFSYFSRPMKSSWRLTYIFEKKTC